jgi:hypothetical protein
MREYLSVIVPVFLFSFIHVICYYKSSWLTYIISVPETQQWHPYHFPSFPSHVTYYSAKENILPFIYLTIFSQAADIIVRAEK